MFFIKRAKQKKNLEAESLFNENAKLLNKLAAFYFTSNDKINEMLTDYINFSDLSEEDKKEHYSTIVSTQKLFKRGIISSLKARNTESLQKGIEVRQLIYRLGNILDRDISDEEIVDKCSKCDNFQALDLSNDMLNTYLALLQNIFYSFNSNMEFANENGILINSNGDFLEENYIEMVEKYMLEPLK